MATAISPVFTRKIILDIGAFDNEATKANESTKKINYVFS